MSDVELSIDASRGALTVKGDQAFVLEMVEKLKFIYENVPKDQVQQTPAAPSVHEVPKGKPVGASKLDEFSNVYDVEGDKISILVSPPGKSVTAQAKALILLFLWARYKLGVEPVSIDDIREQCKAHACLDPKNFTGHVKSQKSFVTVTGANSSMAARLTVPGRKAAEELAQSLQSTT